MCSLKVPYGKDDIPLMGPGRKDLGPCYPMCEDVDEQRLLMALFLISQLTFPNIVRA